MMAKHRNNGWLTSLSMFVHEPSFEWSIQLTSPAAGYIGIHPPTSPIRCLFQLSSWEFFWPPVVDHIPTDPRIAQLHRSLGQTPLESAEDAPPKPIPNPRYCTSAADGEHWACLQSELPFAVPNLLPEKAIHKRNLGCLAIWRELECRMRLHELLWIGNPFVPVSFKVFCHLKGWDHDLIRP